MTKLAIPTFAILLAVLPSCTIAGAVTGGALQARATNADGSPPSKASIAAASTLGAVAGFVVDAALATLVVEASLSSVSFYSPGHYDGY